jgi:flavin-dependent dehydrogenase
MKSYDIIVVGAGFAGCVAAKKCAETGLRTLLLERAGRPGEKVQSTAGIQPCFFQQGPAWLMGEGAPIEREIVGSHQHFVVGGEIVLTVSVRSMMPSSYAIYAFPFVAWESEQAVKAGVELKTATAAVDVIKEGDTIAGIITDKGEKLGSKIVIDAEGSECLLAIKAGIRKKFPADSLELILSHVFDMAPAEIEKAMGNTIENYWAIPEEKLCQPPGEGTPGIFITPMRDTIHVATGQILAMRDRQALRGGGAQLLQTYFDNLFQTRRWREVFQPHVKLRARKFAPLPLYGNLFDEVKAQPCYASGMLMIGDAGAFQTPIGHGVGPAWISGEMAADVAMEALKKNDVSASFLKLFQDRRKSHPLLGWMLDSALRWELTKIPRELPWMIHGVWKMMVEMTRPHEGALGEAKIAR